MSKSGYANIDQRVELSRTDSGNIQRACRFCDKPLHTHDKERVYPDKGPAGSWHYRYVCDTGFKPRLARAVDGDGDA